jgi:hypothetical protein
MRLAILAALGVLLAWEVISRSVAAYLADAAPRQALWLDARQPAALIKIADQILERSDKAAPSDGDFLDQDAQQRDKIRAFVEQALENAPINARGARILGLLAVVEKNDAAASRFMDAAVRFSLRESSAAYWLMRKRVEEENYKDAVYYADILMRTRPEIGAYVISTLARMVENGRAGEEVKAVLAGNPPWRRDFFKLLPASITDARTPLSLLLPLRTTATPPAAAEINPYLIFLTAHKFFDLAYYAWQQFLPPGQLGHALLFNGSFETPPSGGPFDWTIMPGSGVTIDIVPRPDDGKGHALLVEFQHGRVEFHSVTQLVVMTPGAYRFTGKYKGELSGSSGLKWRVACVAETAAIQAGESPVITGAAPAWRDFAFSFTVPEAGCGAQRVRLDLEARMASERLVSGHILFDELEIQRSTGPPP